MNIKLKEDVSFFSVETGMPVLKQGRIIEIITNKVEKFDIHIREESTDTVVTVIVQESEIIQDEKGKDVVTYKHRTHSVRSSEVFVNSAEAKTYMRGMFS